MVEDIISRHHVRYWNSLLVIICILDGIVELSFELLIPIGFTFVNMGIYVQYDPYGWQDKTRGFVWT